VSSVPALDSGDTGWVLVCTALVMLMTPGGGLDLLGRQAVGVLAVTGFSFCATYLVARAVDLVLPLRVSEEGEVTGLDQALHSESADDLGSVRSMGRTG
jgi:Amt family ammonium transporter